MSCLRKAIYLLGVSVCVRSKLDIPRTELDIEEEVSLDTKICEDAAKLNHNGDLNASLDLFVTCLLKKLEKLPDNDDQEIAEVMSTLETLEHLNVGEHNIVKREADDYYEEHFSSGDIKDIEDIDYSDEILEEGRRWKKNKKKKQKKKNRRRWKEANEEIQEQDEEEDYDVDIKGTETLEKKNTDIGTEENASDEEEGQSQVLQFSAYSETASQPQYQAQPEESGANIKNDQIYEDEKEVGGRRKYLYSVDYQGNSHYIDEEDVSALLKTPAAKKAMMKYFHQTNNRELQFPEANQMSSYFRTEHDYHQYGAAPEKSSSSSIYLRESQSLQEPSSSFPSLEYFGPKDYVPESPYLLQGGQNSPGVFSYENKFQGGLPAVKKNFFEKLEPKPRSFFKRDVKENFETIKSRFALQGRIQTLRGERTDRGLKKSREGGEKIARLQDRCQKCKDISFSRKKERFCKNVCTIKNIQKDNCKLCKSSRYRTNNPKACSNCVVVPSSTTTTTTTTTKTPARSIIEIKRKCREEKSNSNQCVKILDKCNSRSFRATHTVCEKREGDSQWLKEKCLSSTFLSKYGSTCRDLCSIDDEFSNENPKICSTEPESLEEIVKKCASLDYYKDNKEKCEVVEKIDLVLEDQNSASNQKADIVDSIQRQTVKERKNIKNQKSKNDKKKKNKKKKKESNKRKKKKKPEKVKKSKCNKPKYAAIHPKECNKIDMKSVLAKKCRKKKYNTKHKIRCTSIGRNDDTTAVLNNEVINEANDKRCRKESFRNQYPKLCNGVPATIGLGESKEWLIERCKHDKFFNKNEKLCAKSDTINKEDNDDSDDSDVSYEITTTPFTTPTTTTEFQEEAEVTTET